MPSETLTRVALFPLSVVLFPQGVLPLRVFEARYMDMVRDCMRDETSFGVCLVSDAKGAGTNGAPATADVGCLARITAWDMQQLGLLQIRTVGGDRFRLLASESQPNGLMMGEIDLIEADEDQRVPDEHRPCVDLLTRIIEDMSAQLAEKRRTGEADRRQSRLGAASVRGAVSNGIVGLGIESALRSAACAAESQAKADGAD